MALAIGALADHWGYGAWVFPPLGYVDVNLVQGVAAHQFGREPVFAYLYLLPAQIFFAITLVLMAGMVAMWLRNPRHVVTWATLPFVLAACADRAQGSALPVSAGDPGHRFSGAGLFTAPAALARDV